MDIHFSALYLVLGFRAVMSRDSRSQPAMPRSSFRFGAVEMSVIMLQACLPWAASAPQVCFAMLTLSLDTSEGRNLQKSRQSWFSHSSPRWLELWRVASASMCRDHGCIVDPSTIIYSCLGMRCPVDFVADAVYLPEVIYIIC